MYIRILLACQIIIYGNEENQIMKLGSNMLKFAGLVLSFMFVLSPDVVAFADEEQRVVPGVYVDEIDIGGMTEDEAKKALEEYVQKLGQTKITVHSDDNIIETTVSEFGYKMKKNDFIEHGLNVGTTGNVVQRYKELKDVENGGLKLKAEFEYDKSLIEAFVADECTKKDVKAKEPQMIKKNNDYIKGDSCEGLFNYKEGSTGRAIDTEDTLNKLLTAMDSFKGEEVDVVAKVDDTNPKFTVAQLKKCKDLLATYSTDFATSSASRKVNVRNATSFINGVVVYPGEEFSTLKLITPFNAKNGYKEAGSYSAGKVVDTYGGGVCQVSTTLYNAVMRAELEVTVRSCHSMCVNYVPVSYDAAISESSGKDFKFVNNTDAPIYIEGYATSDHQLHFSIYGAETRPANREVKFKQVIVKTIEPGAPVVTKDSSKYEDYQKVTQSAHTGYKAELYKRVYVDGVMVEETLYNKSSYKASPKYMIVGTKKRTEGEGGADKDPETTKKPESTKEPDESEDSQPTKKPESTKKPTSTKKPESTKKPAGSKKPQTTKEPASTKAPSEVTATEGDI